jgi:hypothetical protein
MSHEHHSGHTDGHHHPHPEIKIWVNTRDKTVHVHHLSYADLARLAFHDATPDNESVVYTISWTNPQNGQTGLVSRGGHVEVHNGMEFDVEPTDQS